MVSERGRRPPPRTVRGIVTIVQEDRLRLVDAAGRGYLLIIGPSIRRSLPQLWALAQTQQRVTVVYTGQPDLGGVAIGLRVDD